jgi:long-subunit acyl-CoA synthetase (AMP-forming)
MVDEMDKNIPCSRLHFNGKKSCNDESSLSNDRLFAILYTSGSTGVPKGARILHTAAINRLKWQWEEFPYKQGDVCAFKVNYIYC